MISYQSGKRNEKADALTRKLCDRPINDNDKRLEYCMQILLPLEYFEHAVDLQPIKQDAESQSSIISVEHRLVISEYLTVPKEMQNANLNDNLCTQICAYLEAPREKTRPIIHMNSFRISNGLLMKADCLWMPEGKDKQLRLKMIKKMHDQHAVGHSQTKKILNMLRRYYY